MPHRRKRSSVGSDTGSDVEDAGRRHRHEMHDGRVMLRKRNMLPLLDEQWRILRVALRSADINGHAALHAPVFRKVCQIVVDSAPVTRCPELAETGRLAQVHVSLAGLQRRYFVVASHPPFEPPLPGRLRSRSNGHPAGRLDQMRRAAFVSPEWPPVFRAYQSPHLDNDFAFGSPGFDGSAFVAEKNINPIPTYRAAPRRPISPTGYENSTSHPDGKKLGVSIQANPKRRKQARQGLQDRGS